MKSLQEVTDAYGHYLAKIYPESGGLQATYSTGEGGPRAYPRVSAHYLDTVLTVTPQPVLKPREVYSLTFENGSSVEQVDLIKKTHEEAYTFTLSMTSELKIGVTLTGEISLKKLISLSQETSVAMTFSTTATVEKTTKTSFEWEQKVVIPARSRIVASLNISDVPYDVAWRADVRLAGNVAVEFENETALGGSNKHRIWYLGIDSAIDTCIRERLTDMTGYRLSGGAIASTEGRLVGTWGTNRYINIRQEPYGPFAAGSTAAPAHLLPHGHGAK